MIHILVFQDMMFVWPVSLPDNPTKFLIASLALILLLN